MAAELRQLCATDHRAPAPEAIAEGYFPVLAGVFAARREGLAMALMIPASMIRRWQIYHREEYDFVTTAPS
jgi:hypothetical protein